MSTTASQAAVSFPLASETHAPPRGEHATSADGSSSPAAPVTAHDHANAERASRVSMFASFTSSDFHAASVAAPSGAAQ